MKIKIIILFILILLPIICFAGTVQDKCKMVIGKKNSVTSCNPASDLIGYKSTPSSAMNIGSDDASCVYTTASCTGTLGYGYAYHSGTDTDTAKMCVYQDNGATATTADGTDAILPSMTCQTATSSTDGEWAKTGSKLGGSVVSGTGYFVCVVGSAGVWAQRFSSTGTERRYDFDGTFSYSSPPADFPDSYSNSDTSSTFGAWVEIE
jgi:hypothetical protein